MHKQVALTCLGIIAATLAANPVSAQTIATINGSEITQAQLDAFAEGRTGARATPENQAELIDQLGDLFLLSDEAIAQNYHKDRDVEAQLELQKRSVLAQAAVTGYLQKNGITDADVRAEYDREFAEAELPSQYKARHILVETEEAAKGIITELKNGGDFEALAKEKSTGPSGPQGGDLGWFAAEAMVAEFSGAVAALEDGKYSEAPVQTQFGWHVILREGTRQSEAPSFEELQPRIRQALEQRSFQTYFEDLRSKAKRVTVE
ncbi:MAG: peptidylprolyl isomerase [Woeseiaceae bacterium]